MENTINSPEMPPNLGPVKLAQEIAPIATALEPKKTVLPIALSAASGITCWMNRTLARNYPNARQEPSPTSRARKRPVDHASMLGAKSVQLKIHLTPTGMNALSAIRALLSSSAYAQSHSRPSRP
jgi:hypothetical protein